MRRAALAAAARGRSYRGARVVAAWTKQTLQDHFFKEAKKAGYVSRAAYKLLEIQRKHGVIRPGAKVLDLGCVPGAWLQVACQQLGPRERGGVVLGVDLQPPVVPPKHCDDRVRVIQADARLLSPEQLLEHTTDVSLTRGGRRRYQQSREGAMRRRSSFFWQGEELGIYVYGRGWIVVCEEGGEGANGDGDPATMIHTHTQDDEQNTPQNNTKQTIDHTHKHTSCQGFDAVLSDMLQFTSGVNDVELSLDLAGAALHVATGCYYDMYGEQFEAQVRVESSERF